MYIKQLKVTREKGKGRRVPLILQKINNSPSRRLPSKKERRYAKERNLIIFMPGRKL
jgi:hypothetical protein